MSSSPLSAVESALLSLSPPPSGSAQIISDACSALASDVLLSPLARCVLKLSKDASGPLQLGVDFSAAANVPQEELLALGVALLHAYGQVNWTGPALALDGVELFAQAEAITSSEVNAAAIDALAYCGEPVYHLSKLTVFLYLALQVFGVIRSPFDAAPASADASLPAAGPFGFSWSLQSVKAWRLRAGMVWLKVLDEPVPLPAYIPAEAASLRTALPLSSTDRSQLSLSLSLLASLLSRSSPHSTAQKEASLLAREAAAEEGLEWELTGRMGKRTKWQIDEKTQLVVLARDRSPPKGEQVVKEEETKEEVKVPEMFDLNDDTLLERTAFTVSGKTHEPSTSTTPLSELDPANQPSISPFSQAVLLSLSLATLTQATNLVNLSEDALSTSQISAFVARVLLDPQNWSVHSMALLLRCRAEAGRSRTVERGVLQMQALVDQLRDGSPTEVSAISSAVKAEDMASARDRLAQFHALAIPAAWDMEKELATRYLSLGITKSALEIFTRLEMWEEVARCWNSLERPDKGIQIIKDLLEGRATESEVTMLSRKADDKKPRFTGGEKREAKLWCILGELEREPKHYEKAWEVSNHTSSRAQRSLGAVYWQLKDYEKAREALRKALRINPLFPRTWFVLGCAEMRLEDWIGAQEAFGRCVALEEDDAESWSNLASCHLRRGELEGDVDLDEDLDEVELGVDSTGVRTKPDEDDDESSAKERLPFSRKKAAYHCLKQAIKYSYESWRMWYNYMIVAVDVGELSEATRALDRMIAMRASKDGESAVDFDVLNRLVDAVTRTSVEEPEQDGVVDPNFGKGLAPRVERLIAQTILPKITGSARIYQAQARLFLWRGDYAGALDAHLKAYRAGVASDEKVEHDLARFREAAEQVEETVSMLENLGEKDDKHGKLVAPDWKFQARSLVRTFLGRTKTAFEDEPEHEKLKELVKELRA